MTIPGIPFLSCPLLALTGLDCPFCGGTRATIQLAQGDVAAALDYNALWVLTLPAVIWLVAARVVPALGGPTIPSFRLTPRVLRVASVVIIAFAVVRNLPISPLSVLKA